MRFIPSFSHGGADYVVGLFVAFSPLLLGFADHTAATYVPVVLGLGALLYSILTNYEWGLIKVIPFKVHLILDIMSGLLLLASPWIFGFADRIQAPHVALGMLEVGTAALTNPRVMGWKRLSEARGV